MRRRYQFSEKDREPRVRSLDNRTGNVSMESLDSCGETRPRQRVVTCFIAVNLIALFSWVMLPTGPIRNAALTVIEPYMMFTGLCQNFWVFSPDVNTSSAEIFAEVKLKDGQTVQWQYPNNASVSIWEKPFKERYREFATSMLAAQNRSILNHTALVVAAEVQRLHPNNPPTEVALKVKWSEISLPGGKVPAAGTSEFFRTGIAVDSP